MNREQVDDVKHGKEENTRSLDLHIEVKSHGTDLKYSVFSVEGCLDANTAFKLTEQLEQVARRGVTRLILDLSGVFYLSSSGIDCFTNALKAVKPRGGDIVLVNLHERVLGVLRMYGYENAFPIRGSVVEAVSFLSSSNANLMVEFPFRIRCPFCSSALKLSRPRRFGCPKCGSVMNIDASGTLSTIQKPKRIASPSRGVDLEKSPVQVFGQLELITHLENDGFHHTHCISIGNPTRLFGRPGPDSKMPSIIKQRFQRALRLRFYDVEEKRHLRHLRWWQFPKRVPKRSDVRKAIRFYQRTKNDASGYTIHCWQGVSRSTGFALGYLYMLTGSERKAKQLLQKERPEAGPHRKIVQWFDEELGSQLKTVNNEIRQERIERWKRELGMIDDVLTEQNSTHGNIE